MLVVVSVRILGGSGEILKIKYQEIEFWGIFGRFSCQ